MRRFAPAFLLLAFAFALCGGTVPAAAKPTDAQLAAIKANCRSDFMSNCWGVPRGGAEAFQCLKEHMAKLSPGCQTAVKAAAPAPAAPPAPTEVKTPEPAPAQPAPAPAAAPATEAAAAPPAAEPEATSTPESATAPKTAAVPAAKPATPAPAPAAAEAKTEPAPAAEPTAAEPKSTAEPKSAAEPKAAAAEPDSMPPIIGFIPPRKKLMVQRHCRQDLKTYCADVDLGDGRVLRCLLSNRDSLTPDCQGALAKLSQ